MSRRSYGKPPKPKPKPKPPKQARNRPWILEFSTTAQRDLAGMGLDEQRVYTEIITHFALDLNSCSFQSVEGADMFELRVGENQRATFNFNRKEHKIIIYRLGSHQHVLPSGARRDALIME